MPKGYFKRRDRVRLENEVNVGTVTTGSVNTGAEYAEDSAHTTADAGNLVLGVRNDAGTTLVDADGDYSPLSVDPSGNLRTSISSGGGGTQYTEGDTDASITGTAAMMEVAADTLQPVQGTVADGLLVNLGSNNDVTVSGVATAANQLADGHNVTVDNAAGDAVFTRPDNLIDTNNSTTTPLGGGATYTGTGTDVSNYASVAVTLYADVDSAASGMQFQFSTDNTNWDDVHSFAMDVSESDTRRFQFPVTAQYFRVVYTNGGGAQSAFRVQTILHRNNILTSIHRVGSDLTTDRSAQLVRAVIAGETTAGGGAMVNAKVNPSGTLQVMAEQDDADNLLCNANIQVGDADVSTSNPVPVSGTVAHDAADSGNPIKFGGRASSETGKTNVSADDRVDAHFDLKGHLGVNIFSPDGGQGVDVVNVAGFGGLFNIPATLAGNTPGFTSDGDTPVAGSAAHDAAVQGNPVLNGLESRTTNPTAVGDGDVVRAMADDVGRQVMVMGAPRDLTVHQHTAITTTSETTILTAGGAGVFHDLTSLIITNEDNQSVQVTIKDDTAGTTRMVIALAPKGGANLSRHVPVTQAAANDNWTATLDVNPTNNVNFFVQACGERMRQTWYAGTNNVLNTSATEYNAPWCRVAQNWVGAEANREQLCAGTGVIHSFYVKLSAAPGGSGTYTFNLRKNGSTELTIAITDPDTTGSDYTEFSVSAGDLISIQCVPTGSPSATPYVGWSFIYHDDDESETIMMGGHQNNLNSTDTEVNYLSGGGQWNTSVTPGGAFNSQQVIAAAGTLKDLYVEIKGTPDPGTYLFQAIEASNTIDATVGLGATTANNTSDTISLSAGANVFFKVNPSSSPTVRDAFWGTIFESQDPYEHVIPGGTKDNLNGSASTEYNFINASDDTFVSTETDRRVVCQCSTIFGFRLELSSSVPVGHSYIFTLMKNGSATSITDTISVEAPQSSSDEYVEVDDGDYLSLEVEKVGALALSPTPDASWGFRVLNIKPFPGALSMMGCGI